MDNRGSDNLETDARLMHSTPAIFKVVNVTNTSLCPVVLKTLGRFTHIFVQCPHAFLLQASTHILFGSDILTRGI